MTYLRRSFTQFGALSQQAAHNSAENPDVNAAFAPLRRLHTMAEQRSVVRAPGRAGFYRRKNKLAASQDHAMNNRP